MILQPCPTLQKQKLNQESYADHFPAEASDEINRGAHGAASGQQVVYHQDSLIWKHGVLVDLDGAGAVLQGVGGAVRLIRQLPGLSDQRCSCLKCVGQCASDNEPSCLDANYQIDAPVGKPFGDLVDGCAEGVAVRQQRRDVFEEDPFLGKVRDVPDFLL